MPGSGLWQSSTGMTQAGFTEEAALSPLSTHDAPGLERVQATQEQADGGREQPREWRREAPAGGRGRAGEASAISAHQQSGSGRGASPGTAGTRPGSAAGGSAGSVPPAFVLAAAGGARPAAMKGPSVCARAAPLGFHS